MYRFKEEQVRKVLTVSNGCCKKWGLKITVAADFNFQQTGLMRALRGSRMPGRLASFIEEMLCLAHSVQRDSKGTSFTKPKSPKSFI
jgi:hypothetical protein